MLPDTKIGLHDEPIAQNTRFRWILCGQAEGVRKSSELRCHRVTVDTESLLKRFCEVEELHATTQSFVFDASSRTSNERSLNDILCTGPTLQNDGRCYSSLMAAKSKVTPAIDLASLVTGCVYLVLCDFCQFVINICVTGALLCVLVQLNQPWLCFKSSVYV